ncbi:MAG: DUF1844 domain-containing protein [Deltaproteobacteria bacterium]|nr:DUF1844 domain-containing protein [Deltaproteobacteria bacterium]MBW2140688.1 DUF1844 domain-containing protein [Deltaproteobacteria bacterium]MBW2322441.1 DUF1844 domain-containing protein [Deltaproteobacteria bacterium]
MSDEEEKGFVIKDRRLFPAEGEAVKPPESKAQTEPEPGPEKTAAKEPPPRREEREEAGPLPEVTLSTFIFSLSTSALLHLGEIPDPNTNQTVMNLGLAKQTIDIIGMLKEKTKGNLEEDESKLLENLLYELRMKYVAASKH